MSNIANSQPVPYKTTDAILAQCLANAGVPEFIPPTNTFTADILRKLGYKGTKPGEGPLYFARIAWKRGDRGRVDYTFEKTPEATHFLGVYKELTAQADDPFVNLDASAEIARVMRLAAEGDEHDQKMDEREAVFRITFVTLKCRVAFVNRYKNFPARLEIPNAGETITTGLREGQRLEQRPGGNNISLAMTDEQLRKMKLL